MKYFLAAFLLVLPLTSSAAERIIGVGLMLKQVEHGFFVEKLVANAPAARDGTIQEGDQIVSVRPFSDSDPAWVPLEQLNLDEVVQLIRGDTGSRVGLHLAGARGQYEVVLTREPIDVP